MIELSFKFLPDRKDKDLSTYAVKRVNRLVRRGVRVFVETTSKAMVSGGLRDDTGMSRASLLPLAKMVQIKTAIAADIRGSGPSRGYTPIGGTYDPNFVKSKSAGEELGKSAFTLEFATKGSPIVNFSFSIVVLQHLVYNDTIKWGYGPTQSVEKGRKAMVKYIREHADELIPPRVFKDWLINGKVPAEA